MAQCSSLVNLNTHHLQATAELAGQKRLASMVRDMFIDKHDCILTSMLGVFAAA